MSTILTSLGQSLLDLALQEGGSLEALLAVQEAYNAQYPAAPLALTDLPPAGTPFTAPDPVNADLADYFAARHYRLNTGDVPVATAALAVRRDFLPADFSDIDFQ